jgi:phosphatidylethanolamine-binding protein (PEBP) family uncharacterized protein
MKSTKRSLAMALALSFGVLGVACSPEENNNGGSGGTGGKGGSGGSTAGRGGSSGGSSSTGGTTGGSSSTGGTGGSTGGTGGSTGGTGGSTGGTGGSTGGSGGSTGGSGGSTGGSGGAGGSTGGSGGSSTDGGKSDTTGGAEGGSAGKLTISVPGLTMGQGGRMCYADASNDRGNKSPAISWTGIPSGAKSLVLSVEDQSSPPTPHQVVCNIPVTVMDRPADVKAMLPMGAEAGYGHGNKSAWYGPGAGNVRPYEIRIWALSVEKLEGGCGGGQGPTRTKFAALKAKMNDATFVLGTDAVKFWGNASGACN